MASSAAATEALTDTQKDAIEKKFGRDMVANAIDPGTGKGNRARLVRLTDGRLATVYTGGRVGDTYVREVD